MRRSAVAIALVLIVTPRLHAQSASHSFFAAGGASGYGPNVTFATAFGGDRVSGGGFTIGGDVGLLAGHTDGGRTRSGRSYRDPLVSIRVGLRAPRQSTGPFFFAGLSMVAAYPGWSAGVGITHFWSAHLGVRMDATLMAPFGGEGGLAVVRIGIALRR